MSNDFSLTNEEIIAAQQLIAKAGCDTGSYPPVNDPQMYAAVLEAEKRMIEEVRQIYDKYKEEAEREYADWKWRDNKEDKLIARQIRANLGLDD